MTFLNPLGLIGLISLPIIVILHLLRERQRQYVVSHLELWSFLDIQARGPRTRRIPITRLLLLDLLVALLVSLAWAQPSLAIDLPGRRAGHLVILLDHSASMLADAGMSTRFEQAQAEAVRLVEDAPAGSVITVIGFARQARLIVDSRRESDAGALIERILTLRAGSSGAAGPALRAALAIGQAALDQELPPEFHIFTDAAFGLDTDGAPFSYPQEWHWVGAPQANQAVIDLKVAQTAPDRLQVLARAANFSDLPAARRAVLRIDGRPQEQAMLDLPPNAAVTQVWEITLDPGASEAAVTLEGADALPADDFAATGLQPGRPARVLLVSADPSVIQQAVQAVPNVTLEVRTPEDYLSAAEGTSTAGYDLTILRGFAPEALPAGEVLLVEPPLIEDHTAASGLLADTGLRIPGDAPLQTPSRSPLTEGVDFGGVRWSRLWRLAEPPPGMLTLLQAGDAPVLQRGVVSQPGGAAARLTVLLADLKQGNFTKHPAFPILIANLIDQSRAAPLPAAFKAGEPLALPAQGSYRALSVVTPAGQSVDWQDGWPAEWSDTGSPGLYRFDLTALDGETTSVYSAANSGDAAESDLRPREWTASVAASAAPAGRAAEDDPNFDLWPWLLGAALLALVAEAWLAWRS